MKATTAKPKRVYVLLKDGITRGKTESFTVYGLTLRQAKRLFLSSLHEARSNRKAG